MEDLGEPFSAERALQAGLINAIVPADQLEATALKAAKRLAAKPRPALMTPRPLLRAVPAGLKSNRRLDCRCNPGRRGSWRVGD